MTVTPVERARGMDDRSQYFGSGFFFPLPMERQRVGSMVRTTTSKATRDCWLSKSHNKQKAIKKTKKKGFLRKTDDRTSSHHHRSINFSLLSLSASSLFHPTTSDWSSHPLLHGSLVSLELHQVRVLSLGKSERSVEVRLHVGSGSNGSKDDLVDGLLVGSSGSNDGLRNSC